MSSIVTILHGTIHLDTILDNKSETTSLDEGTYYFTYVLHIQHWVIGLSTIFIQVGLSGSPSLVFCHIFIRLEWSININSQLNHYAQVSQFSGKSSSG